MLTTHMLRYGAEEPLPAQILLRAGPLTMRYENGDLRYIRLGDQEVVRRIYIALRDRNWGTVLNRITDVQMEVLSDSFRIRYVVENHLHDIDFTWNAVITGDDQGRLTFRFDGLARSTFLRNRLGFCVLHPLNCAGAACRVERTDGQMVETAFPTLVAPQYHSPVTGRPLPHGEFHTMRATLPGRSPRRDANAAGH
jgi:hypothetical protein